MTEHQIQAIERQRQHLVAQSDRERRLAALEAALTYEVEAHEKTKAELNRLKVKLQMIERCTDDRRPNIACVQYYGIDLYAHYEVADGDVVVTEVYVNPGQSIYDLLSMEATNNIPTQIVDMLESEARHG